MREKRIFFVIKALSIIGIGLAVYLLWQQLAQPVFKPCTINESINCDSIISGAVAKTLGIPTPLYGLIGYIIIFFAAVWRKKKLVFLVAAFGLVFCLWIAYREFFELNVICPVCITCQVVIISIFLLSAYTFKRDPV